MLSIISLTIVVAFFLLTFKSCIGFVFELNESMVSKVEPEYSEAIGYVDTVEYCIILCRDGTYELYEWDFQPE